MSTWILPEQDLETITPLRLVEVWESSDLSSDLMYGLVETDRLLPKTYRFVHTWDHINFKTYLAALVLKSELDGTVVYYVLRWLKHLPLGRPDLKLHLPELQVPSFIHSKLPAPWFIAEAVAKEKEKLAPATSSIPLPPELQPWEKRMSDTSWSTYYAEPEIYEISTDILEAFEALG